MRQELFLDVPWSRRIVRKQALYGSQILRIAGCGGISDVHLSCGREASSPGLVERMQHFMCDCVLKALSSRCSGGSFSSSTTCSRSIDDTLSRSFIVPGHLLVDYHVLMVSRTFQTRAHTAGRSIHESIQIISEC